MLDGEVEGGTRRRPLMVGEALQSVQDLDPQQVHQHHSQEAQTWRREDTVGHTPGH